MKIMLLNKRFWTAISFATFALFLVAVITQRYWLNVGVIILGLLIKKYGSPILFLEGQQRRKRLKKDLVNARVIKVSNNQKGR